MARMSWARDFVWILVGISDSELHRTGVIGCLVTITDLHCQTMDQQERKLALPALLKILTSNNVPVPKAMAVASKVCVEPVLLNHKYVCMINRNLRYKEFNTASLLAQLTDVKLKACGVEDKETRKAVLAAIRKVGYNVQPPSTSAKPKKNEPRGSDVQLVAGPSQPRVANTMQALVSRLRRKIRMLNFIDHTD